MPTADMTKSKTLLMEAAFRCTRHATRNSLRISCVSSTNLKRWDHWGYFPSIKSQLFTHGAVSEMKQVVLFLEIRHWRELCVIRYATSSQDREASIPIMWNAVTSQRLIRSSSYDSRDTLSGFLSVIQPVVYRCRWDNTVAPRL